jgi:trigger factor
MQLPGFRPGKVPKALVQKRLGKAVDAEIGDRILQDGMREAMGRQGLRPLGEMEKESLDLGATFKGVFTCEVLPEIALPEPTSLELTDIPAEPTDADVDERLMALRRRGGSLKDVADGVVQHEDLITVSGTVTSGEVKIRDIQDLGHHVGVYPLLGKPEAEVKELVVGKKVGDAITFSTVLPEAFAQEEWRGKTVEVALTIQALRRLEPAPLDEAFFAGLGGVKDLDTLRSALRAALVRERENAAYEKQLEGVQDQMLAKVSFDLPPRLWSRCQEQEKADATRRGQTDETATLTQAERNLRLTLLGLAITAKMDIRVTEQELQRQVQVTAWRSGKHPREVIGYINQHGLQDQVMSELLYTKSWHQMLEAVRAAKAPKPA